MQKHKKQKYWSISSAILKKLVEGLSLMKMCKQMKKHILIKQIKLFYCPPQLELKIIFMNIISYSNNNKSSLPNLKHPLDSYCRIWMFKNSHLSPKWKEDWNYWQFFQSICLMGRKWIFNLNCWSQAYLKSKDQKERII